MGLIDGNESSVELMARKFGLRCETIEWIRHIYAWQHYDSNSFFNGLCKLYMKADSGNSRRLDIGFPGIEEAFSLWNSAGDNGDDLFRSHGLMK